CKNYLLRMSQLQADRFFQTGQGACRSSGDGVPRSWPLRKTVEVRLWWRTEMPPNLQYGYADRSEGRHLSIPCLLGHCTLLIYCGDQRDLRIVHSVGRDLQPELPSVVPIT